MDEDQKQRLWDFYAKSQQSNDPTWKKLGRAVIDVVSGSVEGLIGKQPIDKNSTADWSNLATQGLTSLAGLPFANILPRGRVYHGTGNAFNEFDAAKSLNRGKHGAGLYFAEDPEYASTYAIGDKANVMPAIIDNKNTLDLNNLTEADINALLSNINTPYKRALQTYREKGWNELFRQRMEFLPIEELEGTGFDAIRSHLFEPSKNIWTIPASTPVRSGINKDIFLNKPK